MPTKQKSIERRLAAILAADVEGYSRLMGQDEPGTMRILSAHRKTMDAAVVEFCLRLGR
jgi:adenylate cyclase